MQLLNLDDYEAAARETLTQTAYDYIAGGADDEITLRENRAAFARIPLKPRVLAEVGERDLSTTLLGNPISFPVLIAPSAFQKQAHRDGELATARAATAAGTFICLSTASTYPMEQVSAAAGRPLWFQLYCYKDRGLTRYLVDRAKAAGFNALMLTADTPLIGRRERDIRNNFALPPGMGWANVEDVGLDIMPTTSGSALGAYIASQQDHNLSWRDVEWLAEISGLPVFVKGVMCAEDALLAADHGATGIVVSNHGGRQLDTTIASIDVLPEIKHALANSDKQLTILLDGGIRRGTDILKSLALGAHAVMIGRPAQWGLAVAGEAGVLAVLELLKAEFDLAMTLAGCKTVAAIGPHLIGKRPQY